MPVGMEHSGMEHFKSGPHGVEFDVADVDHNHHYYMGGHGGGYKQNPNVPWGAALGGALVGGVLGWAGHSAFDRDRYRHGGWGGPDGCGGHGGRGHGCHDGCGEDRHVNRFELKQSEELACKDAKIAKLESEKFAEKLFGEAKDFALCAADKAANRVAECLGEQVKGVCKTLEKVAEGLAKTNDRVCALDKHQAMDHMRIECVKEEIREVAKDTNKEFGEMWRRVSAEFVHQPKVKICCGTPTFTCGDSCSTAAAS